MFTFSVSLKFTVRDVNAFGEEHSVETELRAVVFALSKEDALRRATDKFKREHDALPRPAHERGFLVDDYPGFRQTLPDLLDLVVANSGRSVELSPYTSEFGYPEPRGIDVEITPITPPDDA